MNSQTDHIYISSTALPYNRQADFCNVCFFHRLQIEIHKKSISCHDLILLCNSHQWIKINGFYDNEQFILNTQNDIQWYICNICDAIGFNSEHINLIRPASKYLYTCNECLMIKANE